MTDVEVLFCPALPDKGDLLYLEVSKFCPLVFMM